LETLAAAAFYIKRYHSEPSLFRNSSILVLTEPPNFCFQVAISKRKRFKINWLPKLKNMPSKRKSGPAFGYYDYLRYGEILPDLSNDARILDKDRSLKASEYLSRL